MARTPGKELQASRASSAGRPARRAGLALSLVFALALPTCDDPVGPPDLGEEVEFDEGTIVAAFQGDSVMVRLYDGPSGRLVDELTVDSEDDSGTDAFRFINGAALDRRRGELLFTSWGSRVQPPTALFSVDLSRMEVRWQEPLTELAARWGRGVRLWSDGAPLLDGDRWVLLPGFRLLDEDGSVRDDENVVWGMLALERGTRAPAAFLDGFRFAAPRAGRVAGSGADGDLLAVAGPRDEDALRLMIYDSESLALRDSVFLAEPLLPDVNRRRLWSLTDAGDGRHLFALTVDSIFRVDARDGVVTARARIAHLYTVGPAPPPVAATADPPRFYLADPGGADFPGNGQLQVYDGETLADLGTVDLRSEVVSTLGGAPVARGMDVDEDAERLYVAAGTGKFWFGFTAENTLSVVDVGALTLLETHELRAWDVQELFSLAR